MPHIALYEPEIPPNTGNIIRLCANSGATLHLIKPLGFTLDDKQVKRAGLDYHEMANVHVHDNYAAFLESLPLSRLFACSTHGTTCYTTPQYQADDIFLFGPESRGLPRDIREQTQALRIPMKENSRSLNLSNTVAIVLYEALRQSKFSGLA